MLWRCGLGKRAPSIQGRSVPRMRGVGRGECLHHGLGDPGPSRALPPQDRGMSSTDLSSGSGVCRSQRDQSRPAPVTLLSCWTLVSPYQPVFLSVKWGAVHLPHGAQGLLVQPMEQPPAGVRCWRQSWRHPVSGRGVWEAVSPQVPHGRERVLVSSPLRDMVHPGGPTFMTSSNPSPRSPTPNTITVGAGLPHGKVGDTSF